MRAAITEEASAEDFASELVPGRSIPEPVGRRFENYELMLQGNGRPIELGRGIMGITYKALDVDLRCPVTLKVISEKYLGDESARLRFLREARAAVQRAGCECRLGFSAWTKEDPDPRMGTPWEKGERLAKPIAHCRTLLILDGLEPLQNPPGPQEGRL